MTDYIKREDAIQAFDPLQNQDWYTPWIVETLKDLTSADVAPVRHGRWYKNDQDKLLMRIRCSICNKAIYSGNYFAYCPICGARMDEEVKE